MSLRLLPPELFLQQACERPLFDVRTPVEYARGHIPGALNLPLFDDQERHEVGLLYQREGREAALHRGLEAVGPRLNHYLSSVRERTDSRQLLIYCWRGGMRSRSLGWLLSLAGYRVAVLQGGYKAYRRQVQSTFAAPWPLLILSGMTGSGKTELLEILRRRGEQTLDLEALAQHRGSAFGAMNEQPQPATEQFENRLCAQLRSFATDRPIWVEDESRKIGQIIINENFYQQMRRATALRIDLPRALRVERLCIDYGDQTPEKLACAVASIRKRLGEEKTRTALQAIAAGDREAAAHLLLDYYDKTYLYGLSRRESRKVVTLDPVSRKPQENASTLIALSRQGSLFDPDERP